ncbi:coenzyme F420-0:L-glutamate ligase [Roseiflexus castenholzii]|jgi:coenzyme F420-0:L-glutamate ligase/coenzyme F420-1:gamma-L-glutamate ligase|uniref:F420-dependent oxidoreductase, putative n=1 Tax=Roseiflexus castenholzii (strain DSM 13941 / HLO8) TaxID=383372 RepID=A7NR14_ROSCS|nr:coenzyme F420-0:L-glutamate ligase [Roseiflexus castenholzii]ABU60010.1 F420-dependent oxidoreductase, putative [Roseiflexus castenholzii DSM 13941]
MNNGICILPIHGIGEVQPGDNLADMLVDALRRHDMAFESGDVLVVTQKVISKAEGRLVNLETVEPSHMARMAALQGRKDAAYYEVVLRESRRIVRMDRGVLITETHHGFVCANAGVDESNVPGEHCVTLLPIDPDASAMRLRLALRDRCRVDVAVIISDTFGRPWREGQVNVAIGVAGLAPLVDYVGQQDSYGYTMHASVIAVADELASAAELVMGKVDRVPAAVVRGYSVTPSDNGARVLIRAPERDLFR